jgi:hypothetical protein
LDQHEVLPMRCYFKPNKQYDTIPFKLHTIYNFHKEFKNANKYVIWEDREDHVEEFLKLKKMLKEFDIELDVKQVFPEKFN